MDGKFTYIDLDGVILDTQRRMLERKFDVGFHNHKDKTQFDEYFEYTKFHNEEWDYIIKGAKSINNSVEIIQELQKLKKNIAILTKSHTLYEMKVKVDDLRNNREIYVPIIFVPLGVKKYQIIIPNGEILIDDSKKNIEDWIINGGLGYIFDENISQDNKSKIKSLELLLKR